MIKTLAFWLAFTLPAYAQPRGESGVGMDAEATGGIIVFFLLGSYLYIRDEFKKSQKAGTLALVICAALGIGGMLFEPVRMLMALVALVFVVAFAWKMMR